MGTLCHLARPERFELPTARFVAEYSIQLSYGRIVLCVAGTDYIRWLGPIASQNWPETGSGIKIWQHRVTLHSCFIQKAAAGLVQWLCQFSNIQILV